MKLSLDEVRHVAGLARLNLSSEEEELFSSQLSQVLEYINTLNEAATDDVAPAAHALEAENVFRPDEEKAPFQAGAWSKNAPSQDQGHLRVPKIIEA